MAVRRQRCVCVSGSGALGVGKSGGVACLVNSDRGGGASGSVRGSSRSQQGQRPLWSSKAEVRQRSWGVSEEGNRSVCSGGGASRRQQKQRPLELWSQEWQPVGVSKVG